MTTKSISCLALLVVLFVPPILLGQSGGTILGSVTDPSGSVVPDAKVLIKSIATSATRSVSTDERGFYSAPNLNPAEYEISVAAQGFNTEVLTGLVLTVGGELTVNAQLKVGNIDVKLEVTGAAAAVELTSSTLSHVVGANTIRELPLNGRDWTQLAVLQPGVAVVKSQNSGDTLRVQRGQGVQLTISGGRPSENNYRLNSITINDYANTAPGSSLGVNLGVDAIQEFSVLTSTYAAEYGRTSGGVVNAVTRSGTNTIHGSSYEFLRNSALDARNFFDRTTSPPPFKRNQFGGSIGGPVIKDKTFFFFDYEGFRESLGTTITSLVPSVNAHQGIIVTGGNTAQVAIDPKVAPFLALYPVPNAGGTADPNVGRFAIAGQRVSNENFYTTRIDHRFSEKDNLNGMFLHDVGLVTSPDEFNNKPNVLPSTRYVATMEESHAFSPSLLNSFRLGLSRTEASYGYYTTTYNPLLTNTSLGFLPGQNIGILTIGGLTTFTGGVGRQSGSLFFYTSYQLYDDVYWTRGIHSIKFGFGTENIRYNSDSADSANGTFTFSSFSDFLQNKPATLAALIPGSDTIRGIRQTVFAGYIQDDMRLRKNLTVNLGVRYEMVTDAKEDYGRLASLKNLTDPAPTLGPLFNNNPSVKNFAPRVGFSWDPFGTGKTSIRSGFGIFDVLLLPYILVNEAARTAPFYLGGTAANPPAGCFPQACYSFLSKATLRTVYVQPDPSRSYKMQWNLNVERDLGKEFTLTAGYVGARGVHLPWRNNNMDTVIPTVTSAGYVYPTGAKTLNPNFGRIAGKLFNADSSYNGLQLQLKKRFSHRVQGQISYTWQKSIDTGSGAFSSNEFSNTVGIPLPFNTKVNRGLSDFNVAHVFSANYQWVLPQVESGPGVLRWATNGWQLGGIFSASSAQPFTALISGDAAGSLMGADSMQRPIPICSKLTTGNISGWINFACFAPPPKGIIPIGIVGRNTLVGPGLFNTDFSLFKNNRLPFWNERINAQFRVEIFNILNHPNFAAPTSPIQNAIFDNKGNLLPSAGVLSATQTTSRQIQFGLKIIF
jgi:hypothetical protein